MQRDCVMRISEGGGSVKTDSQGNVCPLCIENGLMQTILDEDDKYYLCRRVDGGVVMEHEYMLVPKLHTPGVPPGDLYQMLSWVTGVRLDNLYVNLTAEGGRQLEHPHIHLIHRTDGRPLGMNGLIKLCNELEAGEARLKTRVSELEREVADLQARLTAARRRAGLQLTGN